MSAFTPFDGSADRDSGRAMSEVSTVAPVDEASEEVYQMADAVSAAHEQLAALLSQVRKQSNLAGEARQLAPLLAEHAQTLQTRLRELKGLEQQFQSDMVALRQAVVTEYNSNLGVDDE